MSEPVAEVSGRRRVSRIWIVPVVALLLGLWMVAYTFMTRGPEVTVTFATAEGIEAGKTKVKARSVDVGIVETVRLADDLEHVVVTASLDPSAEPLLREGSQFWVVRPRVGAGGVSGLGTLVSGGYIELSPGDGPPGRREFEGLDDVPVTPAGTPGLAITLVSEDGGSVTTGDPILYHGFRVGHVDSVELDVSSRQVRYRAFVEAPYDALVDSATRFWNASGLSFSATADGIRVSTGSLQSLLLGGVALEPPEDGRRGQPVDAGAEFTLYADRASVDERPYRHGLEYVVRFARSVRGLRPGAPVEYRGIRVGTVERILVEELVAEGLRGAGDPIPVLVRLEPGRLALGDSAAGVEQLRATIASGVAGGLRASLASGSLLTGQLFVALDYHADDEPRELGRFAGRPTLPAVSTGLDQIEQKLSRALDKVNDAPIEEVLVSMDATLRELRGVLASEGLRELPGTLDATLEELRVALTSLSPDSDFRDQLAQTLAELDRTLRGVQRLTRTLEQRPSALLFSDSPDPDPEPSRGAP